MIQKRNTAYKIWISDIHNGSFTRDEEGPYVLQLNGYNVNRVNLIGTIINKQESENGEFIALTLDDGSDAIRIKAWREDISMLKKFHVGDPINIIGRLREYNNERYI